MSAAEVVDTAAAGRVLVLGSPPPAGRDLDLVALPDDRLRVEAALRSAGFEELGGTWARFGAGTAEAVELIALDVSEHEVRRALADGVPLPGFERLVRPAPADDLLVLALLLRWGGWKEKRRPRLDAATPEAWEEAARRAPLWGVRRELSELRAGRLDERRPSPRRPRVIALSGIDGSGKSTQARALQASLERLGYQAVVAWTPLSQNASLGRLAKPVKTALRRLRGSAAPVAQPQPGTGLHRDEGTALRDRSRTVFLAWTTLVAVANGLFHLRESLRHAAHGRVVIFDRYLLDTEAQWGFRYGENRDYTLQNRIVQLLSPRPAAAFFLDIPADVSLARKPDDRWTPDELRTQERRYRAAAQRADVTRLDGLRDADELAAAIAAAAWRALAHPAQRGPWRRARPRA